ncbi:MAG TPA: hypothetical protein VLT90_13010 [Terriglobales bacterium]|nr:hypothetical protein [Terriglobales bacterium]
MKAATDVCILVAWSASLAFAILYGLTARWWKTQIGRHMMTWGVLVFVILSLSSVSAVFGPDYAARPIVRLAVFFFLAGGLVNQLRILVTTQLRRKKDDLLHH